MNKITEAFVKKLDEETQVIYDAWIFKHGFIRKMEDLSSKIQQKFNLTNQEMRALAFGENQELLNYINTVKRSIEKLEEKL